MYFIYEELLPDIILFALKMSYINISQIIWSDVKIASEKDITCSANREKLHHEAPLVRALIDPETFLVAILVYNPERIVKILWPMFNKYLYRLVKFRLSNSYIYYYSWYQNN